MNWIITPVSGRLDRRNASPAAAAASLTIGEPVALDIVRVGYSPYLDRAVQGATLAPRPFWFVTPDSDARGDRLRVRTDPQQSARAKPPWTGIELTGQIETSYLYATILEIYPYMPGPAKLCALPIDRSDSGRITLLSAREVARRGAPSFSEWLQAAQEVWDARKKDSVAQNVEVHEYLDNHSNLTRQRLVSATKLMYGGKGTHVRAAVVNTSRVAGELEEFGARGFVFDMNTYYVDVREDAEAHYLAAILNTAYVDDGIKETQTQGAFGARDIHRRPLEMFAIPEYDAHNEMHRRLAEISEHAHERLAAGTSATTYERHLAPVRELVDEATQLAREVCESWNGEVRETPLA